MAINHEERIAIYKRIGDSVELGFDGGRFVKTLVGVEVISIVEIGRIVVVTIGRGQSHLLQNGFHAHLEPLFPFPLGKQEEAGIGCVLCRRCGCPSGILDILGIHDVRVGHVEEGELVFVGAGRSERPDVAPIAVGTYPVGVNRIGGKIGSQYLVAGVVKFGTRG